jgi:hypothetical protein
LFTVAFFAFFLLVLRPGYDVNDDVNMIGLASGYFGGKPVPFLIYSNSLLGLILNPLYAMHTAINWEILIFVVMNFLSVWVLLYLVFSRPFQSNHKLFGLTVILLCDSYFLLNITFTTIAAFAAISGICATLTAVQSQAPLKRNLFFIGAVLVWMASLIRVEPTLLMFLLVLPPLVFCYRSFDIKNLMVAFAIIGLLVSGCYAFDKIYVGSSPDWNSFYNYDTVRSALQDTHRLTNIRTAFQEVGWSNNDLKQFSSWFFPDKDVYSFEKLQYLVQRVPTQKRNWISSVMTLISMLFSMDALPYLLLITPIWLAMAYYGLSKKAIFPLLALTASLFALDFYIAWTMKIPGRVLLPSLTANAIFGFYILDWASLKKLSSPLAGKTVLSRIGFACIVAVFLAAIGLVANQSIQTTKINTERQAAYRQILFDLNALQVGGKINKDALIVSPAYGVPLEWSNPMILDFPKIQYLDMGWLTFSPAYRDTLRKFNVETLPAGFYQSGNLYLMTKSNSLSGILQFIKEHAKTNIDVKTIYTLRTNLYAGLYSKVSLYKLEPGK